MSAWPGAVTLRPTAEADIETLFAQQCEPGSAQMAGFIPRDHEAFVAHWQRVLADTSLVARTILLDGAVAGNIGCFGEPGAREVGYWVGQDFWGRHVATRALAALLAEVTDRPLRGFAVPWNIGSQRVLLSCGFVPDGEDGEHLVFLLS